MLFGPHLWATGYSCRLQGGLEQVAQADRVVGDYVQISLLRSTCLIASPFGGFLLVGDE